MIEFVCGSKVINIALLLSHQSLKLKYFKVADHIYYECVDNDFHRNWISLVANV